FLFSSLRGKRPGSLAPFSTSCTSQLSMSSCSAPSLATKSASAAGITTAPSSSATTMSPGKIAQPPQPIGSFQPTKVSWLTEAGAATPAHQTGRPVAVTPCLSRITPSVISAPTPRLTMRMHKMSPKMPAPVTPMASATTTQFSGMASIALRVEIGFDQLSGVARSSRTGTKRSVKARPTTRLPASPNGMAPAIQERRMPFFSSMVVMVPVVTLASVWIVDVIDSSGGFQAEPLVAAAQIGDEWGGQQHHPELADDLAEQEVERAESKPQEHDRIDDKSDRTGGEHRQNKAAAGERGIDREIGKFGQQERRRRGDHQRGRRQRRRNHSTDDDGSNTEFDAY